MTQICDAVYENGVFRPASPPDLAEGQQVRLVVQTETLDDILALAASVYSGLSRQDIDDVERIAFDRSAFFREPAE